MPTAQANLPSQRHSSEVLRVHDSPIGGLGLLISVGTASCPERIRTSIIDVKGRCPAVRRPGSVAPLVRIHEEAWEPKTLC